MYDSRTAIQEKMALVDDPHSIVNIWNDLINQAVQPVGLVQEIL